MKVTATKAGFHGRFRTPGEEFDVPDGSKASWFKPTKELEADVKRTHATATQATADKAKADAVNALRAAELAAAEAKKAAEANGVPEAPKADTGGASLV